MDDISAAINQFLSNEENVKQLGALASAMGLSEQGKNDVKNTDKGSQGDLSGLMQLLSNTSGGEKSDSAPVNMPDMAQLMKIQKIFSSFSKEDENILLLKALKPHLQEKNQKKVDDAIRIMQLISVLPMIKESGLFGGDLF